MDLYLYSTFLLLLSTQSTLFNLHNHPITPIHTNAKVFSASFASRIHTLIDASEDNMEFGIKPQT